MDLRLTDDGYQRFLRDGRTWSTRVRLTGVPRYVKVIVYDYASDLLGSTVRTLK